MTGSLQEKNNKFFVVLNYKENGKRKQKWISTGLDIKGNKRKANELLIEYLQKYEEEDLIGTKDMLFSDFMLVWLDTIKNSIKENTFHEYSKVVKGDIKPYFSEKNITMKLLNNMHIQEYYNHLLGKKSSNSVLKRHANIHKALDYAVMTGLIDKNPSDYVMLPKKNKFIGKYYNEEQLNKLFEVSEGYSIESVVKLTGYYGFRRSEILGLRWCDVNLKDGTIIVQNTVVSIGGKAFAKETTKTKSSNRTLPLDNAMKKYLKQLKKKQLENQLFYGNSYQVNDFVCKWENGQPFKPDYITYTFKRILEENNLPIIRFHDLRHSSASMLLKLGCTLKEIQDWLGHSDINTTANCYSHLQYEAKVNMANKMSGMLEVKSR